ncbi:MAG: SMI1/KNR4 family protein [Polyangiaceae bacterium]|nr:SMI1/KNR4 family protein [Polyangiaceae bacterium]
MIEMRKPGRALAPADIAAVEDAIGCALPATYRAFLCSTNGGRPMPDTIDIEGAHFRRTDVSVFFGIDRAIESENILWNLDIIDWCKENKLLPIAGDSGANTFMLLLADDGYGRVYYFDAADSPPTPYRVAANFNEFLSKLREPKPDELP